MSSAERSHPRLGLTLSGGGFRASFYAAGVLRYMAEAGSLAEAVVVSGVSGGSITTGLLGTAQLRHPGDDVLGRSFVERIFDPLLKSVAELNTRNAAIRRWLTSNLTLRRQRRDEALAAVLGSGLLAPDPPLRELPSTPQLVIATTDLASGRAFRLSRDFVGSWDYSYGLAPEDLRLSTAVSASAAVPFLFPPLQLPTAGLGLADAPEILSLVDGGVYDNLGLEWVQGWTAARRPAQAQPAEFSVTVNASGRLGREQQSPSGLRAWNRSRKIQYAQTQATRIRWLVAELEAGRAQGVYLGIAGDPRRYRLPSGKPIHASFYADALPSVVVGPLTDIRTDLNRFSRTESELLAYHGYWSAHARFASLHPRLAVEQPAWREYAGMTHQQAGALVRELRRPRHRFGAGNKLR